MVRQNEQTGEAALEKYDAEKLKTTGMSDEAVPEAMHKSKYQLRKSKLCLLSKVEDLKTHFRTVYFQKRKTCRNFFNMLKFSRWYFLSRKGNTAFFIIKFELVKLETSVWKVKSQLIFWKE